MNENETFELLEKLNKEKQDVLNSKFYRVGRSLYMYLNNFKKLNFARIRKDIFDNIATRKVRKNFEEHIDEEFTNLDKYDQYKNKRIAVYTCITGDYDYVQVPLVMLDNVDYFLLTDTPERYKDYSEYFIVKELSDIIISFGSIKANRYVKFHPFDFFADYDYAIYLDANIRIIGDIRKFVNYCNHQTGLAMHRHNSRRCVYREAEVCKILRRGNIQLIDFQMDKYRREGFPEQYGLNDAGVIVSNLQSPSAKYLLEKWWEEFIQSGTMRDQLSWPYVLWKEGINMDDIGNLGNNKWENYKIEFVRHK